MTIGEVLDSFFKSDTITKIITAFFLAVMVFNVTRGGRGNTTESSASPEIIQHQREKQDLQGAISKLELEVAQLKSKISNQQTEVKYE